MVQDIAEVNGKVLSLFRLELIAVRVADEPNGQGIPMSASRENRARETPPIESLCQ